MIPFGITAHSHDVDVYNVSEFNSLRTGYAAVEVMTVLTATATRKGSHAARYAALTVSKVQTLRTRSNT